MRAAESSVILYLVFAATTLAQPTANDVFVRALPALDYIDDWNAYHRWTAEIHCGTNVIQIPPQTLRYWWEDSTN